MKTKKMDTPLLLALAALTTLALSGCTGSEAIADSAGGTKAIDMKDVAFSPATVTVKAGTTVTWTNQDDMVHTVTAEDGSFDSGDMDKGDTFSHAFNKAGTYYYYCVPHAAKGSDGHMQGMVGKIIVQ